MGDKGDAGSPGLGGLSNTGFTMRSDINMARHKIINQPNLPSQQPKKYVEVHFNRGLTADGLPMRDHITKGGHEIVDLAPSPSTDTAAVSRDYADGRYVPEDQDINMSNHRVYNLPTSITNDGAATKNYVDDKKCVFKDGSITTADIILGPRTFMTTLLLRLAMARFTKALPPQAKEMPLLTRIR